MFRAFGLKIQSAVEFNQISLEDGPADVNIRWGRVPVSLDHANGGGILYQADSRRFLLVVDQVARYLVVDGNEILVDPAEDADLDSIRLFLMGSAFGALLHQRDIVPIHGSAVHAAKGAVILSGDSGSGKSTIAAALYRRGYRILADDVCAVHALTPAVLAPGIPALLLWADALRTLQMDVSSLRPARPKIEKYLVPFDNGATPDLIPVHRLYVLECSNSGLSGPTPITGLRKLDAMIRCTYRPGYVHQMGRDSSHLRQITEVTRQITVRRVSRPRGTDSIEALTDLIERDLG